MMAIDTIRTITPIATPTNAKIALIDINGFTYTCTGCDSLVYNPNSYQWEPMVAQPVGIVELKTNTANDSKMYDLLGREIFEVPKGTIYIKNRKKFIR